MSTHPKWPFELELPVLWGDMDAFNHVNNVRFFRWFESARIEYFRVAKAEYLLSNKSIGPILAHTHCDYLLPIQYPDTLIVQAKTSKIGQSSLTQDYQIVVQSTNKVHATGQAVMVMIDYQSGQKVDVDDSLKKLIATMESA